MRAILRVMAIQTYTEQLEAVQAAITAILDGGQSVQFSDASGGERNVTRADLGALQKREAYLRARVAAEARGGIRVRGVQIIRG